LHLVSKSIDGIDSLSAFPYVEERLTYRASYHCFDHWRDGIRDSTWSTKPGVFYGLPTVFLRNQTEILFHFMWGILSLWLPSGTARDDSHFFFYERPSYWRPPGLIYRSRKDEIVGHNYSRFPSWRGFDNSPLF